MVNLEQEIREYVLNRARFHRQEGHLFSKIRRLVQQEIPSLNEKLRSTGYRAIEYDITINTDRKGKPYVSFYPPTETQVRDYPREIERLNRLLRPELERISAQYGFKVVGFDYLPADSSVSLHDWEI